MSTRRDRYSIVITLQLIAGISSLSAGKAATPTDACSLLTAPQASSALGAAVGQGQQVMPNNATICTWTEQGRAPGSARNVTVSKKLRQRQNAGYQGHQDARERYRR
jgi:hypothetical protein